MARIRHGTSRPIDFDLAPRSLLPSMQVRRETTASEASLRGRNRPPRAAIALALGLLAGEAVFPGSVAVMVLFSIPVLLASRAGNRRATFLLAGLCTAACAASMAFAAWRDAAVGLELATRALDASAAVLAIWAAATLGLRRTRAETLLRAARAVSEVTLDTLTEAVITVDVDERVTLINKAAETLTGFARASARGRKLQDVFRLARAPEEPRSEDSVAFEGPSLFAGARRTLSTPDGRAVPVDVRSIAFRDEHGRGAGLVLVFSEASERQKYEAMIKRLAYRDDLTGLPNRTSFWERLGLELAHAERDGSIIGLLYLDLDGFKAINDTLGHRAGDALLKEVGKRLRAAVRKVDTVARLGGDEFTIVLPCLKRPEDAERVAAKVLAAFAAPIDLGPESVRARPSIGIALYPKDAKDAEQLVHRADQAMYEAKHSGGASFR